MRVYERRALSSWVFLFCVLGSFLLPFLFLGVIFSFLSGLLLGIDAVLLLPGVVCWFGLDFLVVPTHQFAPFPSPGLVGAKLCWLLTDFVHFFVSLFHNRVVVPRQPYQRWYPHQVPQH